MDVPLFDGAGEGAVQVAEKDVTDLVLVLGTFLRVFMFKQIHLVDFKAQANLCYLLLIQLLKEGVFCRWTAV